MTSDHLGELSPERRALWSYVLGDGNAGRCDFPLLGRTAEFGPLIAQIRRGGPGEEGLLSSSTRARPAGTGRSRSGSSAFPRERSSSNGGPNASHRFPRAFSP